MLRFLSQNGCSVFSHKTGAWLSFIATWILTIPNLSVINHRYFDFDDTKSLGYHFSVLGFWWYQIPRLSFFSVLGFWRYQIRCKNTKNTTCAYEREIGLWRGKVKGFWLKPIGGPLRKRLENHRKSNLCVCRAICAHEGKKWRCLSKTDRGPPMKKAGKSRKT